MTNTSKTIVFFGNERLATGLSTDAPTLRMLINEGYRVAAVICNNQEARSRKHRPLEIEEVAAEAGIPVLKPARLQDIYEELVSYNADIGVLVAFGKIVPQPIIDIFPAGIVNIHPSLLPAHRGSIPIESVILEGASQTGVSLMSLVREMDAGPVYAQSPVAVEASITKASLATQLLEIGCEMLKTLLPEIISGDIIAKPQDEALASYDQLIKKEDGKIDWSLKSAQQIEREVRAFANWPKSSAKIGDHSVIITEVAIADNVTLPPSQTKIDNKRLYIGCKSGTIELLKLIPEGKKEMEAAAFLAGHSLEIRNST